MGDFAAFFDQEYEGVVRALTLVFGDRPAAEDAAQVGFERALVRWTRVSSMDRPGTWVYVVALRHGRRSLAPREVPDAGVGAPTSDHAQAAVDRITLLRCVEALPPRQRAVVVLRHLAGLHLHEIADALDIRVGTVKSTLHAAHRKLRIDIGAPDTEVVTRDAS